MISKKTFDNFIKNNLVDFVGNNCFGYKISNRCYENYYNQKVFQKFVLEMQLPKYNKFFNQYNFGKGSELKEVNGRPPKMASVASSSRFCYLALRDGYKQLFNNVDIEFEHGCNIKGICGTGAQLDAYISKDNIYFEVKCHEIFDKHKIVMRKQYWDMLYGQENDFGLPYAKIPDVDKFEVEMSIFNIFKEKSMFDIKQFLCHLLGIASQKNRETEVKLVYLFFKPKMDSSKEREKVEEVFDRLKDEINNVFFSNPIQNFTKKNNIKLSALVEYAKVMEPLKKENTISLFK